MLTRQALWMLLPLVVTTIEVKPIPSHPQFVPYTYHVTMLLLAVGRIQYM